MNTLIVFSNDFVLILLHVNNLDRNKLLDNRLRDDRLLNRILLEINVV